MNNGCDLYIEARHDGEYTAFWSVRHKYDYLIMKDTGASKTYFKANGADSTAAIASLDSNWANKENLPYVEYCALG